MSDLDKDKILLKPSNEILLQVARTLGVGLAIVDAEEWTVLFENANFFKWFPPSSDADDPLT
jgi:hypothetical protein